MGRVVVYIASSLDGFVAGQDDDLSWLESFMVEGEDYGYGEFMAGVGAAVMGARTYAQSLLHPERMLLGVRNHVLSETPMEVFPGLDVQFHSGVLSALVEKIRVETDGDIFVVGGGQVVSSFLNADLVDDLLYFAVPVLLGRGIPLFVGIDEKVDLALNDIVRYPTGIVKLHYRPAIPVRN